MDLPPNSDDVATVSCGSPRVCVAVTESPQGLGSRQSVDGGVTWRPGGTPGSLSTISTVSCSSTVSCWAVGTQDGLPAMARSTDGGLSWFDAQIPGSDGSITDVSCVSDTSCVAVGVSVDDAALVWRTADAISWSQVSIGDAPGLSAISCTSDGACTAVGQITMSSINSGATWSASSAGPPSDRLFSVACESARGCLAVGWSIPRMVVAPLAIGRVSSGDSWTAQGSPQISGYLSRLSWTPNADCIGLTVLGGGIGVIRHG